MKEKQQIQLSKQRLEEIGVRQSCFSDCIPLWKELTDSLESEACKSERFLIPNLCSKSVATSDLDEQKIEDFRHGVESILIKTMLWIQVQHDRQPSADRAEADKEETMAGFSTLQSVLSKSFGFDRLLEITQCFDESLGVLLKISETGWMENQEGRDMNRTSIQIAHLLAMMLKCVEPSGRIVLRHLSQLFWYFTEYHHKTCKLCYISMNLILGLVKEGFCTEAEGEEEAEGGGEFEEEDDGTGMADGQGRKDVSDEIEHQDQINTGTQKAAEQGEHPEPHSKDDIKGIEMEDDFEGCFEDIEKEGEQSESDSGHEGEERLDDQMGKVGKEGETVDERLWDDDPKDNEETQDASEAENEDGRDTSEYMEGRLDEKPEKEKKRKEDTIERGDPMEEEEEEDDGEGDEMTEGEGPPHPGFTKPEGQEEELQLSEDLKLDGEEEDDKDSLPHSEDSSQAPETEEPPVQTFAETEEKENKKEDSQTDIGPEAGEENRDESPTDDQGSQMDTDGNDDDAQPPAESNEKKLERDDSLSVCSEEESEMEIVPQEREGAETEEGDGVSGDPTVPSQETAVAGHQEGDMTNDRENMQQQPMDVPSRAEEVMENYDAAPECGPSALGTSGEGVDGALTSVRQTESNNASKERPSHKESANPLRSLGDALEEWKRHLNVTDAMQRLEEREEVMTDVQQHQQTLEAMEYEFVLEEQENSATMQTLATATEEQMQQVLDLQNEKVRQEDEPEENIDATETTQLSHQRLLKTTQPMSSTLLEREPNCSIDETEFDRKSDDMSIADEDPDRCAEPVSAMESQVCYKDRELPLGEKTMEEHEDTRAEIDHHQVTDIDPVQDLSKAQEKWNQCQAATFALASELTEHLRLVLEPTRASRLAGDYRTGANASSPLWHNWAHLCPLSCRKENQHETRDPLCCQSVSQRQDLAETNKTEQTYLPSPVGYR